MATFQAPSASTPLSDWEKLFYDGYRLRAEVLLFGTAFAGNLQPFELVAGCAQIMRSHGVTTVEEPLSNFVAFQARQPEPSTRAEAWQQVLPGQRDSLPLEQSKRSFPLFIPLTGATKLPQKTTTFERRA